MTTFADLETLVREQMDTFGVNPGPITYLTQPLNPSDATISLATPHAGSISAGVIEVGSEQIYITHHDPTNVGGANTTILPNGRDWNGTSHDPSDPVPSGTLVRIQPMWTAKQVRNAVQTTFDRVYPTLFGVKQATFDYETTKFQYDLPAEAERVLDVRAQSTAAHQPWYRVNRFRFNQVSDPAMPNSISLDEPVTSGQPVIVSYVVRPVVNPDSVTDVWLQTGLSSSLTQAIVYGSVAFLLAFQDAARAQLGTTQLNIGSDNPSQRLGTASGLAAQLEQQFQLQLLQEQKRQRQTWPPVISFTRGM